MTSDRLIVSSSPSASPPASTPPSSNTSFVDRVAMQKSSKMSGVGVGDAAPSTAVSSGSYSATTTAKAVTSSARRILSKSWRSKQQGKSAPCSPAANSGNKSFWIPVASNTWCNNAAGSRVVLTATSLLHLTDVEHAATQKAALARLQALDLGTKINIPKEWTSQKSKRSRFLLKRRVVGSSNALDSLSDSYVSNCKDSSAKGGSSSSSGEGASSSHGCSSGWVFGLPLAKCIANDCYLRRDEMPENGDRRVLTDGSPDRPPLTPLPTPRPVVRNRKSSSSSGGAISCDDSESDCGGVVAVDGIGSITNAKSTAGGNVGRRSSLPDALLLSPWTSRRKYVDSCEEDQLLMTSSAARTQLQVPYIVTTCFQHLQTYGLRVLGIFRIGSSKKRTIQLREEFDRGGKVILTEEHNPHDVAALLKEFFRDLSDPLLTRDLYSAFVATRKLKTQEKRLEAANLLVALLPTTNRDTLWALLSFLNLVRKHSTDSLDEHGNTLPGNKMDSHNLATLFGPNILHKAKGGALQYQVESQERAEERVEVIEVVREMIDHQSEIFALSAELHDEALRILIRTSPEAVDQLLTSRTSSSLGVNNIDADHESTGSGIELDVGCLPGGMDQSAVSCSSPGSDSESTSPSSPYRPGTLIETLQPPPAGPLSGRTIFEVLQAHAASVSAAARSAQAGGCPSALTGAVLGGVDMSLTAVALGCMTSSPSFASTSASAVLSSPSQQRRAQQPEMRICITTDSPEQSRRTQKSATASSSTSDAAAVASASAPTTSSAVSATTTKTTSATTTASTGPTSAATAAESTGSQRASHIGRRSSGVPHGSVRAFEKQLLKQQQSPSTSHHSKSLHHHHHHLQQQPLQHTLTVPTSRYSRSRELDSGSSSAGSTGYSSRGSSISPSPSPEPNSPLVPAAGSTPTAATASIPNTLHLYQRTSPCPPQRAAGHQTNAAAASLGSPPSSRSLSTQRPLGILRPPPISISGPTSPTSSSGTASDAAAGGGSSTRGCSMRWDLVTGHRHQSSRPEDLKEQETLV